MSRASASAERKGGAAPTPAVALASLVLALAAAWPGAPRGFQVMTLAALAVALGSAGLRIARRLLPGEGRASLATAAFTVAVALFALPATLLGEAGLLRPRWFLLWAAAVPLLAALLPRGREERGFLPPQGGGSGRGNGNHPAERALLVAAGIALTLSLFGALHELRYEPAGYFGWDDLSYHLSTVATWARYGDLRMIKFDYGDPSPSFYPINAELFAWALLTPFGDSDVAMRWAQLPFALFSLAAVAAVARRLGLTWRSAACAALLYGSIRRVLPMLALTAGNDHAAGFCALAAVDGTLAFAKRRTAGTALYAGLALGLLVGMKYIGLIHAATLLGVLGLAWWAKVDPMTAPGATSRTTRTLLLLVATMAVAGGYTYARNVWTTGNPVFPSLVRLPGIVLPHWTGTSLAERRLAPEAEIDVPEFLLRRSDLFGPLFPFTLLPGALLAPLLAGLDRRRPARTRILDAAVLALPAVFFLQFVFLLPDHRDMRYILVAVALAAVAFAWLTERAGPQAGPAIRGIAILFVIHHLVQRAELAPWEEALAFVLLLSLGAALGAAASRLVGTTAGGRDTWRRSPRLAAAGAAGLMLAASALGPFVAAYQQRKLRHLPAVRALEAAAGPEGARVAHVGFNQLYPYFGSRLQNDVRTVSSGWSPDAAFYRWGGKPDAARTPSRYERWRRIVDHLGIELVVVRRSDGEDPARRWMVQHPERFRRLYADPVVEVWRVLPRVHPT